MLELGLEKNSFMSKKQPWRDGAFNTLKYHYYYLCFIYPCVKQLYFTQINVLLPTTVQSLLKRSQRRVAVVVSLWSGRS